MNKLAQKVAVALLVGAAQKVGEAIGHRLGRRIDPEGYAARETKKD